LRPAVAPDSQFFTLIQQEPYRLCEAKREDCEGNCHGCGAEIGQKFPVGKKLPGIRSKFRRFVGLERGTRFALRPGVLSA
jgi:hypothetical protein